MRKRVVVSGMGIVAPNGIGVDTFCEAIKSGKSGIGLITRFDATNLKTKVAAEVKNFEALDYMPIAVVRKTDRFVQFGVAATKMALDDARLVPESLELSRAAVIFGSGLGGSSFHEETIIKVVETCDPRRVAASSVPRITPNAVSGYIGINFKIKGPNQVISTACSSSAHAIGEAFRRVRDGYSTIVIAGGVEATITIVNIAMYEAMMVLGTPLNGRIEETSRPFDKTRNGFVMGEGGACLILEEFEHARARGVTPYAEIVGFGSNCGAYHMVAPNPSGEDAKEVMKDALSDAGMPEEEIDYVSAHGTSTTLNDLAETRAIKALWGKGAYEIPVSSIKSMVGHTIGAAAAMQAVSSCLALKYGFIPPTMNLKNQDPECDLDYVPNQSRSKQIRTIMSNSFGFGSNNAALIFRRVN